MAQHSRVRQLVIASAAALVIAPIGWLSVRGVTAQPSILATGQPTPPAPMEIGMNISKLNYWSQEFAFTDLIKSAGLKIVQPGGPWADVVDQVSLDRGGHPVDVPAGTTLVVIIRAGGADQLPGGTYKCEASPGWAIRATGPARMTGSDTAFKLDLPPAPQIGSIGLKFVAKADGARLTRLSCRNEKAPPAQVFNPQFLDETRPFAVLRFMDWMQANGQPPQTWADRATPDSFMQTTSKGVAVEHMVDLANTLDADPWFTVPLDAPDDYYLNFARYVRDNLEPDRHAYVEVSNEVWNGQFEQSRQASAAGALRYPSASPVNANDFYYADRIRAVMGLWGQVYKGQERRIVRVISTQAGSKNRSVAALTHLDTARSVDALATAPYFGPSGGKFAEGDALVEYLISHGDEYVDVAVRNGVDSKAVANRFKLRFITYEGGPAYVNGRPRLAPLFAKAEHDPRMYTIYTNFLERWRKEVGGLYMPYVSVSGKFGHRLYTGQPLAEAPKMRALLDFMKRHAINADR